MTPNDLAFIRHIERDSGLVCQGLLDIALQIDAAQGPDGVADALDIAAINRAHKCYTEAVAALSEITERVRP